MVAAAAARLSSKPTFVTDCSFAAELTVIYARACFNEKLARMIQAAASAKTFAAPHKLFRESKVGEIMKRRKFGAKRNCMQKYASEGNSFEFVPGCTINQSAEGNLLGAGKFNVAGGTLKFQGK